MDASLFSWSGLVISVLVVLAILAVVFLLARAIVRLVRRRMASRVVRDPGKTDF